jgi:hypothetical protein
MAVAAALTARLEEEMIPRHRAKDSEAVTRDKIVPEIHS